MIRWCIFDIGDVVLRVHLDKTDATIARLGGVPKERIQELHKVACLRSTDAATLGELLNTGVITPEEYAQRLNKHLVNKLDLETIRAAALETLGDDIPETIALLERLSKRTSLACFSNTHLIHWQHLMNTRSWPKYFKHICASHELGLAKPDPDSFAAVLKILKASPDECFFTDDNAVNIEGARRSGLHAEVFTNAQKLEEQLKGLGIL